MGAIGKLSARAVANFKNPGRYGDGGGLWLQVSGYGTKAWVFRYTVAGRHRHMGLGPYPDVALADARQLASEARVELLRGTDPIDARKQRRGSAAAEAARQMAFREAAGKYIAAHKAGWKNEKHASQWEATLGTYAYPVIGDLPVAAIDTAHVLKIIEPIWTTKTETASRVRGRIEAVLDWATARKLRHGDNPARWRGHLDTLLPAKTKVRPVKHQAAMAFNDVPEFASTLRAQENISAKALEFTILTAARTGETIGAQWDEIDLAAKLWIVPPDRTKSGREHRVPLSERAVALLATLPRERGNPFLFMGAKAKRPLSNMAMLELLRGMDGCTGLTVHGFRSSFRDWAGDQTNFAREVIETALAHVLKDKTEGAYRRTDALEKRRRLMDAWARYCSGTPSNKGRVIPMRGQR